MEDILSNLPQDLLCDILSKLPTKVSVRTSVLSSRWKNIWSHVPALDLDCAVDYDDLDLWDFIDKYMNSNPKLVVERFKLIYDVYKHSNDDFVSRLNEVIKRRVTHFTVRNMMAYFVRMPLSLYSCTTLVYLNLCNVIFNHPGSELVSLPCLKTLYLEEVKFDADLVLQTLISSCSVLEDLTLVEMRVVFNHPGSLDSLPCLKTLYLEAVKFNGDSVLETLISSCSVLEDLTVIIHPHDNLEVVIIRSQSLKCLKLESRLDDSLDADVIIDTPRLEYMSISQYWLESFVIRNIGQLAKVKMNVAFEFDDEDELMIPNIRNFVIAISKFQEMTISAQTLQSIYGYSEWETLPRFSNLSRLEASLVNFPRKDSSWKALQVLLSCCMNLHSLILELDHLPKIEKIEQSPLPQCVRSSLKFLKLKAPNTQAFTMLTTYFRKNCPVLEKIILWIYNRKKKKIAEWQVFPKNSYGHRVVRT